MTHDLPPDHADSAHLRRSKAREFYLPYLSFTVVFEHRFEPTLPLYMGVRRGDCTLHLSEHHGDASPGAAMRIAVTDIDALCAELAGQGYRYARPTVEAMPWGTRDMTLADPFGNRLTFTWAISVSSFSASARAASRGTRGPRAIRPR